MKTKTVSLISLLAFLFTIAAQPVMAITTSQAATYRDQLYQPKNIPSSQVQDLVDKLEYEVNLFVDRGHLEPGYFERGFTGPMIMWGMPGEQIYILSQTIPYLSTQTANRLKTFLSTEIRSNDADPTRVGFEHCSGGWGDCEMTGNRREFYQIPTSPYSPVKPNLWPPVNTLPSENIYMIWAYAHYTGDWAYISTSTPPSGTRWTAIKGMFDRLPDTPTRYSQVAAAIGYARILQHYNQTGSSDYTRATTIIQNGLTAGENFYQFLNTAYSNYISSSGHDWTYPPFHFHRDGIAQGFLFAPEIGRFLGQHALEQVRIRTTYNPNHQTEPDAIEQRWPDWYMTRGSYPVVGIREWVGHYGENHLATPEIPTALYMIHAFAYQDPPDKLRLYTGEPVSVGDLYYIQRLSTTIAAHGQQCWVDNTTGQETCGAAPDTSPTPAPTPCQKADINQDGVVDLSDYSTLSLNFLKTSGFTNPRADINGDGVVDLTDYSQLAIQFLKTCQ